MRQHQNIHQGYDDPCQRFFNALGKNSYIRPHRHSIDPKIEDLFAIRGLFALIAFDNAGAVAQVIKFGTEQYLEACKAEAVGVELAAGTWHTVLALTQEAVLLEMKAGPFDPLAAKEPAPWSPEEGSTEASAYLAHLHHCASTWCVPPGAPDFAE